MLREVVTTIADRVAVLHVPIRWHCCDSARETAPGHVESTCPTGQTCIGGECLESTYRSEDAPKYAPSGAFGGGTEKGDGCCFDVATPGGIVPASSGGGGVAVARARND